MQQRMAQEGMLPVLTYTQMLHTPQDPDIWTDEVQLATYKQSTRAIPPKTTNSRRPNNLHLHLQHNNHLVKANKTIQSTAIPPIHKTPIQNINTTPRNEVYSPRNETWKPNYNEQTLSFSAEHIQYLGKETSFSLPLIWAQLIHSRVCVDPITSPASTLQEIPADARLVSSIFPCLDDHLLDLEGQELCRLIALDDLRWLIWYYFERSRSMDRARRFGGI